MPRPPISGERKLRLSWHKPGNGVVIHHSAKSKENSMAIRKLQRATAWRAACAATVLAAGACMPAGAVSLTTFSPALWGASDATLGLAAGATIEDFEDVALASGLTVSVVNSAVGGYGPTATLPRTFDPRPVGQGGDDAFGNAFYSYPCGSSACSSVWDGSHALVNTGTNNAMNYGWAPWGDMALAFAGTGVAQVGFSLHQNEYDVTVTVNGSQTFVLPGGSPAARRGYFRFDLAPGDAGITSLTLDGHPADAWVIDHLAFAAPVPEPSMLALFAAGLAGLGLRGHRQKR
jgi:hypothetical protein